MTEHEHRSTDDAPAAVEPQRRPGQELAAARERADISFETMAEGLRLPKRQLEALEADDYASLPPPAYVRGYLRAYARQVGLDGDEIVALFDAASGDLHDPDLHPAAPSGPVAGSGAGLPIGLAVIALVVVAGIGGWWWQGRPPADPGAAEDTAAAESPGGSDAAATDGASGGSAGADPDGGTGPGAQTPGGEGTPGERVADAADATNGESAATPPESEPAGDGSAESSPEIPAGSDGDTAAAGDGDATASADADRVATVDDGLGGQEAAGADAAGDGAPAATDGDTAGGAAGEDDGAPVATGDGQDDAGTSQGDGAAGETAADMQLAEGGQQDAGGGQQDGAEGQEDDADGQEDDAEAEQTRERDTPAATSSAEEATTTAARVGPDELVLEVDGRTWMEVYDSGDRELVYTLYLGSDPVRVRGWAPFDVFLGNSPTVTVRFNGEEVVTSAFTRSDNTARFLVDEDGARRR